MNQNEQQRHQAEKDSRRVSTGVRCEVVTTAKEKFNKKYGSILGLLRGSHSDFAPSALNDASAFNHEVGYDSPLNLCYVIPKPYVDIVVRQLEKHQAAFQDLMKIKPKGNLENLSEVELQAWRSKKADAESNNKMIAKDLLTTIQDHVFMVVIQNDPTRKFNGNEYDVYMHSREQSAPYAEMVQMDQVVPMPTDKQAGYNQTWTKSVQDGRERFRDILKDMSDELKKEAKNGRLSRRG